MAEEQEQVRATWRTLRSLVRWCKCVEVVEMQITHTPSEKREEGSPTGERVEGESKASRGPRSQGESEEWPMATGLTSLKLRSSHGLAYDLEALARCVAQVFPNV